MAKFEDLSHNVKWLFIPKGLERTTRQSDLASRPGCPSPAPRVRLFRGRSTTGKSLLGHLILRTLSSFQILVMFARRRLGQLR